MFKRIIILVTLGVTLSGCFMAPMALIGPAASGFSTASIIQSGVTTGANYVVQKSTGKSISEHVMQSLKDDVAKQSYAPVNEPEKILKQSQNQDEGTKQASKKKVETKKKEVKKTTPKTKSPAKKTKKVSKK